MPPRPATPTEPRPRICKCLQQKPNLRAESTYLSHQNTKTGKLALFLFLEARFDGEFCSCQLGQNLPVLGRHQPAFFQPSPSHGKVHLTFLTNINGWDLLLYLDGQPRSNTDFFLDL